MKKNVASTFLMFCCSLFLLGYLPEAQTGISPTAQCASADLSHWQFFTTSNGTLGGSDLPICTMFDMNGDGKGTKSLRFKVGQRRYDKEGVALQGGGLRMSQWMPSGDIRLSIEIASHYSSPKDHRNLAGGLFEFIVDGTVIAHQDFGPIDNGTTKRSVLQGTAAVSAGRHEIRLQILRPFQSIPNDRAPYQYLGAMTLALPSQ